MSAPRRQALEIQARLRPSRNLVGHVMRLSRANPVGVLGLILVVFFVATAVTAPIVAPQLPEAVFRQQILKPPSGEFMLGTDHLGRDVLSRTIYGTRISLLVGFAVALAGVSVGTIVGITSAYVGGILDMAVQRVVDVLMSIPGLILALALMAALGQSLQNVILALVVGQIPSTVRVIRSVTLGIIQNQYIEAARAIGAPGWWIVLRHVAPNAVPPILVVASILPGGAIVAESSLSFLGLGVPADVPTWGSMLGGSVQRFATSAPWIVVFPGLALSLTVFGINLFGDALRDVLDPRMRGR